MTIWFMFVLPIAGAGVIGLVTGQPAGVVGILFYAGARWLHEGRRRGDTGRLRHGIQIAVHGHGPMVQRRSEVIPP